MKTVRWHFAFVVLASAFLALGCPPGDPMDEEGMGEGVGEGSGEGAGEGSGEGMGEEGVQDAPDRFFVDGARGDDTNAGRRAQPLETIQEAIERAADLGGSVYVAGGVYDETISLVTSVGIFGGYDSEDWIEDRDNFPSTIVGQLVGVMGVDIMNAAIEGFTIMSMDAVEPGASAFGVVLDGCMNVAMSDVIIAPGSGAAGPDGENGRSGRDGFRGSDGTDATSCTGSIPGGTRVGTVIGDLLFLSGAGGSGNTGGGSNGGNAHAASRAHNYAAGGSGGLGGALGQNGSTGGGGSLGRPGANGAPGEAVGVFQVGAYWNADGTDGQVGERGGAGGGGGGGGGGVVFACGGSGASGGEGGRDGAGGMGGQGGGASVGVLLTNTTGFDLRTSDIVTGNGGEGGSGGIGGEGGAGGAPGSGGAFFGGQGGGGNGGRGGNGGNGGHAGGGGGGPVIGIAHDTDSVFTMTATDVMLGAAGLGGMSVVSPDLMGADGLAMDTFEFAPQDVPAP